MAPVHLEPKHKRDSMTSGNNRDQKGILFDLTPICLGPDPSQNEKNNRVKSLYRWKYKGRRRM